MVVDRLPVRAATALLVLPAVWVLGVAAPADAAAPQADSGHPSVQPSPPSADVHAGHVMPTPTGVPPTGPAVDHSEHDDGADHIAPPVEPDRPLGLVLGVFGGINGAVVLVAGALRRRDRKQRLARQQRRSQRRRVPAPPAGGTT